MDEIRASFSIIEDPRHQGYVKHKLTDILIIIMCAVLSGMDTLGNISIYATSQEKMLKEKFDVQSVPSKATFGRILSMVDGAKVGAVIIDIMKKQLGVVGGVLAVDGKAIRSTSKPEQPHSAMQILTAYITSNGVVLGQESIEEKTNEIPVFQEMLDTLDIKGKTITADAMHCQRETCKKIIDKGGDYLFGLKENQPNLHADVALFFEDPINNDCIETCEHSEKNAGRYETRICKKATDIAWLDGLEKWCGLMTVFSIRRIVEVRGKKSDETSYYITSRNAPPEQLMMIAREHWKIESMHWLLDVTFSEDSCRLLTENAHRTLNALRKFALATHKNYIATHGVKSTLKAHMLSCLLNPVLLIAVVSGL